jgi:hypothetical protein
MFLIFCSFRRWMAYVNSLLQAIHDDMDAREIEALSMLSRGFSELKDVNPELSYRVILDILSGINECVHFYFTRWVIMMTLLQ